ncbi:MAG: DUF4442 domain-containing protein [Thermoplasmatota archaeon]
MDPRVFRIGLNLAPMMWCTGGKTTYISRDWHHWTIKLRRRLRTLNYVGTMFGGSLYSAVDPHYMLAFMHILGKEYIVWDKAATIRFRRPAKCTLTCELVIPEGEVDAIKRLTREQPKLDRTYHLELKGPDGTVYCQVEKVLHFRWKKHPDNLQTV